MPKILIVDDDIAITTLLEKVLTYAKFEVCRLLRAEEAFAHTPILIITASDDYNSKGIAYAAGANDYITKPIDQDELPERINSLLRK